MAERNWNDGVFMKTKIIAIISATVIIVAGVGIYEMMRSDGYINPSISILSFKSTTTGCNGKG